METRVRSFFTRVLEREAFCDYRSQIARFRTFIRTCLDNHVRHYLEERSRIKRGGTATVLSLDYDEAEAELRALATQDPAENIFDAEWARQVFWSSVEKLEQRLVERGRVLWFELFQRYDLAREAGEAPSYAALASEYGLKTTDVTNHLAAVRRELRAITLETLRELTRSDDEFMDEAERLLGQKPTT